MFKLIIFEVCPRTGITTYEMQWDLGSGIRTDHGSFFKKDDAEKYVNTTKKHYIIRMFEKYIYHAKVLSDTGKPEFYRTMAKLQSLERCIRYNEWIIGKDLRTICKVIISLENDLRKILPSPSNSSYSSSESRLNTFLAFCRSEYHPASIPQA